MLNLLLHILFLSRSKPELYESPIDFDTDRAYSKRKSLSGKITGRITKTVWRGARANRQVDPPTTHTHLLAHRYAHIGGLFCVG